MRTPGVRRACARYIEPNLPAPTSTARTGRLSASRASRRRWRFMGRIRLRDGATQFTVAVMDRSEAAAGDGRDDAAAARVAALVPGLEALRLPASLLGRDLRYLYVNPAYEAHAGRPAAEFIGRAPDDVFVRVPTDERRGYLERALQGKEAILDRVNLEGPRAGRWVRAYYLPVHGDGADVIGVLVVLVDVQQIKDAEATIAERERQLSLFIDSVGFPITYVDRGHVIRFANRPSCEWSGRTPDAMIGQPMAAVAPPEVLAAVSRLIGRALPGEVATYERLATFPNGEQHWYHVKAVPHVDSAGTVVGMCVVGHDVTELKTAQALIEDKERQLRQVIDSLPSPMCYVDADGLYR